MARWAQFEDEAPELAAVARRFLEARTHRTIATLRRGGAPRISGTECYFVDGDLWFGAMGGSLKARDLQRDPRFALHSGSEDPPEWEGDAKVAGRIEEIVDRERKAAWFEAIGSEISADESHVFRADLDTVSTVRVNDDRNGLVIDVWNADRGVRRIERT